MHRQHLGTRMRDAKRELSLHQGALPAASSVSLAAQLLGKQAGKHPCFRGRGMGQATEPVGRAALATVRVTWSR
jgi:hypothetical protein